MVLGTSPMVATPNDPFKPAAPSNPFVQQQQQQATAGIAIPAAGGVVSFLAKQQGVASPAHTGITPSASAASFTEPGKALCNL